MLVYHRPWPAALLSLKRVTPSHVKKGQSQIHCAKPQTERLNKSEGQPEAFTWTNVTPGGRLKRTANPAGSQTSSDTTPPWRLCFNTVNPTSCSLLRLRRWARSLLLNARPGSLVGGPPHAPGRDLARYSPYFFFQ